MPLRLFNPEWGISERLYRDQVNSSSPALMQAVASVLQGNYERAAAHVAGKSVLDIACGCGYGSRILRDSGASHVVGCDLSGKAIAHARSVYARDGIRFVQGDAERFTWPHRFDVVISFETIEHLEQPENLLARFSELLNPGGLLCLSVPLGETRHLDPFHKGVYTEQSVQTLLEERGYGVEESSSTDLHFDWLELLPLGFQMPETRPTLADLLLTWRGWRTISGFARGMGTITFPQYFVMARSAGDAAAAA
jgi:SAM-dependent methyltransferase